MHQPQQQFTSSRPDSSFIPDQYSNDYIIKREKTQVEDHHENDSSNNTTIGNKEVVNEVDSSSPPDERKRKPLKHYLCCICCPCLPMWARYGCCTLLLLFIIFLIIVGVLAAIFKIPVVDFNGPTEHPDKLAPFERSNSSLAFSVNFGLKIGVTNDNLESITFESIETIAYYPTAPHVSVGGGKIYNVNIKSYGISNFTFPFSINYDPLKDEGFAMLSDIVTKCGLTGGSKEDLYINYDLIPTVRIAGIAISPVIHQSSHFPCPIGTGQLSMGLSAGGLEEEEEEEEENEEEIDSDENEY